MTQVGLQRPRIVSSIGQCITAGVPQHVNVNWEGEAHRLTTSGVRVLPAGDDRDLGLAQMRLSLEAQAKFRSRQNLQMAVSSRCPADRHHGCYALSKSRTFPVVDRPLSAST